MAAILALLIFSFVFIVFPLTALVFWFRRDRETPPPSLMTQMFRIKQEHERAVQVMKTAGLDSDEEEAALFALKQQYLMNLDQLFIPKMETHDGDQPLPNHPT
jgi:hypothetical protein